MSIPMTMDRAELLAQLKAMKPAIRKADAAAVAKHKADEKAHLAAFRASLREALAWDYETAKAESWSPNLRRADGSRMYGDGPICPRSQLVELERSIATLEKSNQKTFTIKDDGWTGGLYRLLLADIPQPKGLC